MNNVEIAKQTLGIIRDRKYTAAGRTVSIPDDKLSEVIVITPEDGEALLNAGFTQYKQGKLCKITVINYDSFQAGRMYQNPLVMNFANAHKAGGGFMMGANAQEEALCRCSTLFASIDSPAASKMYLYNNTHISRVESDHMLISPNVYVFRNEKCEFLDTPVKMGVVTVPAPNKRGAALFAGKELIEETFLRRIRIMLCAAAKYGYKDLVLGAWGCGAFGNKPKDVAGYFRKVIVEEGYGYCFDRICFAIYGEPDGKNITEFMRCFSDMK